MTFQWSYQLCAVKPPWCEAAGGDWAIGVQQVQRRQVDLTELGTDPAASDVVAALHCEVLACQR